MFFIKELKRNKTTWAKFNKGQKMDFRRDWKTSHERDIDKLIDRTIHFMSRATRVIPLGNYYGMNTPVGLATHSNNVTLSWIVSPSKTSACHNIKPTTFFFLVNWCQQHNTRHHHKILWPNHNVTTATIHWNAECLKSRDTRLTMYRQGDRKTDSSRNSKRRW